MEWNDQVQKMMQSWTETQQKMWSNWLQSIEQLGKAPGADLWDKTVDTWQQSVNKTLEAQAEWTEAWAARFGEIEGAPKEVNDWAKEGQAMMRRWNEAQRELWDQWFDVVRKARPEGALGQKGSGDDIIRAWQDTARKAMQTQMQWATAWTGRGKSAPKKGERSAQRSTQ
ncbi:MAG: hypothetical protein GWN84_11225 [Gammaproteobacteria bacterium]|nr:hypothetical protein [Gammaproteobacteria bacterium]NIR83436.1 hypothetical protein [Gammaproteobacteria bacterium]NIR91358.1 hypothetical protein [Gammaproteobacteria bacterium]NIU04598.1 hypothetical protein [Gammaproteobacteria bacterium]NIV51640.1 hypothetical protein [Gammaproteobacteria bacterium]